MPDDSAISKLVGGVLGPILHQAADKLKTDAGAAVSGYMADHGAEVEQAANGVVGGSGAAVRATLNNAGNAITHLGEKPAPGTASAGSQVRAGLKDLGAPAGDAVYGFLSHLASVAWKGAQEGLANARSDAAAAGDAAPDAAHVAAPAAAAADAAQPAATAVSAAAEAAAPGADQAVRI
jgi:hypothetical protein